MSTSCSGGICEAIDACPYVGWKNPTQSAIILGGINLFFLTMAVSKLNLFIIAAYLLLFYLAAGVVVAQFMEKTEKDDNEYEYVGKDCIEKQLKMIYVTLFQIDAYMKKVASLSDPATTAKFFVGVYAFMTFSGWFSDACLICIAINILFAWKPVKNSQHALLDKVCGTVCGLYTKVVGTVDALIPKYVEPVKKD